MQQKPYVNFQNADPMTFYSLMLVDPDAPSRIDPSLKSVIHWMVVNIIGSDLKKADTIV